MPQTPAGFDAEHDLRAELRERDRTIASLQEHLERAVGSLESARRSRSAAGGEAFPTEMVAQQRELADRLGRVVAEWDQLGTAARVERLAEDLAEIRESFDRLTRSLLADAPPPEPREYHRLVADVCQRLNVPPEPTEKTTDGSPAVGESPEADDDLAVLELRPEPLEFAVADHAAWLEAVDCRQKYVIALIRTLRAVETRRRGTVDWSARTDVPEDLRQRVAAREAEYLQKLRTGEVELSIERARLSRLENTLEQRARESEQAARHPNRDGRYNTQSPQGRRWTRFLGGGE